MIRSSETSMAMMMMKTTNQHTKSLDREEKHKTKAE
jgi:hypothetical protein